MIYLYNEKIGENLIRHWATEEENGKISTHRIRQIETGVIYDEAIDIFPCSFTYEATEEAVENSNPLPE